MILAAYVPLDAEEQDEYKGRELLTEKLDFAPIWCIRADNPDTFFCESLIGRVQNPQLLCVFRTEESDVWAVRRTDWQNYQNGQIPFAQVAVVKAADIEESGLRYYDLLVEAMPEEFIIIRNLYGCVAGWLEVCPEWEQPKGDENPAEAALGFYLSSGDFALEFAEKLPNAVEAFEVKPDSEHKIKTFRQSKNYLSFQAEPDEAKIDALWAEASSFLRKVKPKEQRAKKLGIFFYEVKELEDDGQSLIVNVQQISEKEAAVVYYGGAETFALGEENRAENQGAMDDLVRGMVRNVAQYNLETIKMYFYMEQENAAELIRQMLDGMAATSDPTCRKLVEEIDFQMICYEDYDLFAKPLEEKEEKEIRRITQLGERPTVIGHTDPSGETDLEEFKKQYPDSEIWTEGSNIYARIGAQKVYGKHNKRERRAETYTRAKEEIDALSKVLLNDARRDVFKDVTIEEYLLGLSTRLNAEKPEKDNLEFADFFVDFRIQKAQKLAEEEHIRKTAKRSAAENKLGKIHGCLVEDLHLATRKPITELGQGKGLKNKRALLFYYCYLLRCTDEELEQVFAIAKVSAEPVVVGESILRTLIREQRYYKNAWELQPVIDSMLSGIRKTYDTYFDLAATLGIPNKEPEK